MCSGKPCFRGTRIMVHQLFDALEGGGSVEEFLESFPDLTSDDITAAFGWAVELVLARRRAAMSVS